MRRAGWQADVPHVRDGWFAVVPNVPHHVEVAYKPKIVLEVPLKAPERLAPFVEACLVDCVELIAVVGEGCEQVHDQIDDLVLGDGSDDGRFIVTSWHTGETVAEALEFAEVYAARSNGGVEIVRF